ncbi:unnamed protein product [Musa acuminata subsp. burmannicoides]
MNSRRFHRRRVRAVSRLGRRGSLEGGTIGSARADREGDCRVQGIGRVRARPGEVRAGDVRVRLPSSLCSCPLESSGVGVGIGSLRRPSCGRGGGHAGERPLR